MAWIEQVKADEARDVELAQRERDTQDCMQREARERIEVLRDARVAARKAEKKQCDGYHVESRSDIEVEYRH